MRKSKGYAGKNAHGLCLYTESWLYPSSILEVTLGYQDWAKFKYHPESFFSKIRVKALNDIGDTPFPQFSQG